MRRGRKLVEGPAERRKIWTNLKERAERAGGVAQAIRAPA
jgi:hypothetical protein